MNKIIDIKNSAMGLGAMIAFIALYIWYEGKLLYHRSAWYRIYATVNNNNSGAYSDCIWWIFCDYL